MKRFWVWLLFASALAAQNDVDRYIVQLTGDPAAVSAAKGGGRAAAVDRRVQIQAEQRSVAAAIAQGTAGEVIGGVDTVANALFVRATEAQAGRLASLPGVARVYPDRVIRMRLDRALPIVSAPEAWNAAGGRENAGLGAKIGIIDTGIDVSHPGFQDGSLPMPAGFPKVDKESDLAFTNSKVIVARTYENLLGTDLGTPQDIIGHGTAVAMAAGGAPNESPFGGISGAAPKAYLGNYKVFTGNGGTTRTGAILKALDDAVKDGMDVVNISLGSALASRPFESIEVAAVSAASLAGVVVVAASGNEGPDPNTISDFATAPSAIAVGASANMRRFASSVIVEGVTYLAAPATNSNSAAPVAASLFDVARLDNTGLACQPFAQGSLSGRIAFILRGDCTFEVKFNNAAAAGAVAALVYTHAEEPAADFSMVAGQATLPATLVSHGNGMEIKARLASQPDLRATLQFQPAPVPTNAYTLGPFTSRGPNADATIKPDLIAPGVSIVTATQDSNPEGELFDPDGYAVESGTSFSAPIVAGAAAVVRAARPGLAVDQYRSLVINTADQWMETTDPFPVIQETGNGRLNMLRAVETPIAASPTSLGFGAGGSTADITKNLTFWNLGGTADTFVLSFRPISGPIPLLSEATFPLQPGQSAQVAVRYLGSGIRTGANEGFLVIRGTNSEIRIPYWYGVASGIPRFLTLLDVTESGTVGATVRRAVHFRVTDAAGLPVPSANPVITPVGGGGRVEVVRSVDAEIPGAFTATVILGPSAGPNRFRVEVPGTPPVEFTIAGEAEQPATGI